MKYEFDIGARVVVDQDAPAFGATDHSGEVGFITDRHPPLKGYEPPYDVAFSDGDIQSYYSFELEEI